MPDDQATLPASVAPQETASWSEAVWLDRLADVIGPRRRALSPLATVLPPMLIALGWGERHAASRRCCRRPKFLLRKICSNGSCPISGFAPVV